MARSSGITKRHAKGCAARQDKRCNCTPSWQAQVWDNHARRRVSKSFPSEAAARTWRTDALIALRSGSLSAVVSVTTIADDLDALIAGMSDGSILDRSGKPYKPATIRSYRQAAKVYLKPAIGRYRLSELRRGDVQALVDDLRARKLAPSTVHNKLDPLRVLCRRALRREQITTDPTSGLELPSNRGRRDNVVNTDRAAALLAKLPDTERALWTTAFYAALRRGELRALRWTDIDLDAGVIRVTRHWDDVEGEQEPKTEAGKRTVPLVGELRRALIEHRLSTGRSGTDLVFGRTASEPFIPTTIRRRARDAWKAAGLDPLTPHEARHCAASYFIAAGLNMKEIQVYVGHSDVRTTFNVYGHLLPGGEQEAAAKLDAYLNRSAV